MGSRTFIQKLGIYCLGIAIGLMTLGYFQAKRAQAVRAHGGPAQPAAGGGAWTPENVEQTKAAGLEIARRAEAFRADHGRLPDGLDRLGEVPPPAAGDPEWRYVVSMDGTFFFLSFGEDLGQGYDRPRTAHLDSREMAWRVVGEDAGSGG